ncbi:MAG: hypothetical protein K8S00_02735 [Bacteroidales bacterium]|nr:hypothetical protein [Bacteroidales bacterium]
MNIHAEKLVNQDRNIEIVFSYLDELIDKQENLGTRQLIGYDREDKK